MTISGTTQTFGLIQSLAEPAQRTRSELERLSLELASGTRSDTAAALNYDFSSFGLIERDLLIADSLQGSIERGKRITSSGQAALQGIQDELDTLRDTLVPMVSGGSQVEPAAIAEAAETAFEKLVGFINVRQDEGAVFAGGRTDANAISDADTILTALRSTLTTATSPDEIRQLVEDFFDTGGVFETTYITAGSPSSIDFRVQSDKTEEFALQASDRRFVDALQAVASLLTVSESRFADGPSGQLYTATIAAAEVATVQDGVISLAGETGRIEARLESASETLEASLLRAQQARNALIEADPYETATRIQDETARLETIYTLTAQLSRLRLTNYL